MPSWLTANFFRKGPGALALCLLKAVGCRGGRLTFRLLSPPLRTCFAYFPTRESRPLSGGSRQDGELDERQILEAESKHISFHDLPFFNIPMSKLCNFHIIPFAKLLSSVAVQLPPLLLVYFMLSGRRLPAHAWPYFFDGRQRNMESSRRQLLRGGALRLPSQAALAWALLAAHRLCLFADKAARKRLSAKASLSIERACCRRPPAANSYRYAPPCELLLSQQHPKPKA